MIRRIVGFLCAFLLLPAGWRVLAQQQQPAQQPANQQQIQEQQRLEQERYAAAERDRKEQQELRERINSTLTPPPPTPIAKTAPVQVSESCLALARQNDNGFDLKEIPLDEWIAGPESHEIPWKVSVRGPALRLDQRYELGYVGTVDSKDLKWSTGHQEIRYVTGVSSPDGRQLVTQKSVRQVVGDLPQHRFSITVSDCVFLQPGNYVLWVVLYDGGTKRHNVFKKIIHVPEWPSEVLPELNAQMPPVEFPQAFGLGQRSLHAFPGTVVLPLHNKQPVNVEVVSVLSPADQWLARADIVRAINNNVLSATGMISQMRPGVGAVSISLLDLTNRSTPFEQREFRQLNWVDLGSTFIRATDAFKVGVPALEALKQHGTFFRETLQRRLELQSTPMRVFIIVSGSLLFEAGSDVTPIKWEGDCNCRIYHVWLRLNKDDVFDDLAKLMKPLHPKTFDIMTPRAFRKALADIVEDLDRL